MASNPGRSAGDRLRHAAAETKQGFKTTEFWAFLGVAVAILIAGLVTGGDGREGDVLRADDTWLYITILTVGYLLSRGLAKSGTRDSNEDASSQRSEAGSLDLGSGNDARHRDQAAENGLGSSLRGGDALSRR